MMNIIIRQEQPDDYWEITRLLECAFREVEESDHQEHFLVERLRCSKAFIPQLALVAESADRRLVGYVLLTKVEIVSETDTATSLGVAPLAVLPEFQGRGIGGNLLREAHRRAVSLGYRSAVLLGHPGYYPRFGYRRAGDWGIRFPFDVPDDCCMAIELFPGAFEGVRGIVRYDRAFFE